MPAVHPQRAGRGQCPICAGDGCALYPPGGSCTKCFGSGVWKSPRTQKDWPCRYCDDGVRRGLVICRRVQSEHQKGPGWIHSLTDDVVRELPPSPTVLPLASIEARHAFYSALLDSLPLSDEHFDHLQQIRGLSEYTISEAQFKSVPSREVGDRLVRRLIAGDLGIPGLFTVRDKVCLHLSGLNGFYVPIRDEQGRIAALQVKNFSLDPKAAKYLMLSGAPKEWMPRACAGTPNHFIRFDATATSVLIIEGILKSEIVAEYAHLVGLRCPIVACVGTGSFGEIGAQLRRLMPGLRVAFTAFDRNAEGKSESDTRERERVLWGKLAGAGVDAQVIEWPEHKGFDDFLLSRAMSMC